jgi:methionyl-tRNA synthetase
MDEKRIDEVIAMHEKEAEEAARREAAEAPMEEPEHEAQIAYDAFMAVELRCAQIVECEPVPKAKKLLKLQVDLGYEKRQIVSGIAKFYKPEDLIGKKVAVVTNLAPATLCGVESRGMLLAAGDDPIRVIFLDPATRKGERIR